MKPMSTKYATPQIIYVCGVGQAIQGTETKGPSLTCETYARPNFITLPAYEADE